MALTISCAAFAHCTTSSEPKDAKYINEYLTVRCYIYSLIALSCVERREQLTMEEVRQKKETITKKKKCEMKRRRANNNNSLRWAHTKLNCRFGHQSVIVTLAWDFKYMVSVPAQRRMCMCISLCAQLKTTANGPWTLRNNSVSCSAICDCALKMTAHCIPYA